MKSKLIIRTFTILFTVLIFGFSLAQNTQKFDRNFQLLYNSKDLIKSGKNVAKLPKEFQTVTSKANGELLYSCIIYTNDAKNLKAKGIRVQTVLPKFVTALVSINDLDTLLNIKEVKRVQSPTFSQVNNEIAVGQSGASLLHAGALNNTPYKGKGVLVAIVDTGIYWKHPDFRDPTNQNISRIINIWDQTLTPTLTETSPPLMGKGAYGVEYTQSQINDELSGAKTGVVREADTNGHGTHVSGTAAGNGSAISSKKYQGMAPESNIIFVKAGNRGFSSTNIINSLKYIDSVATARNMPVVVNMSLGGYYNAHDGTGEQEQAIDGFSTSKPGRVVVVAAGNDNGSNIHKQTLIAPGATETITFNLSTNTSAKDLFGFLLYSNSSENFSAVVTAPSGEKVTSNIDTGVNPNVLSNGITVWVDNFIDPANNNRYLDLYLQRVTGSTSDVGGAWTLAITNNGTASITTDGWRYAKEATLTATIAGSDSNMLIGSPGSAKKAITTASYSGKLTWYSNNTGTSGGYSYSDATKRVDGISTFSSNGPLRDGSQKPDIAATGDAVVSALSSGVIATNNTSNIDGTYYQMMQGTSMATPVVTGAVALMLQAKPTATAAEIKNAIINNAFVDNAIGLDGVPNPIWGYGKLDVFQATSSLLGGNLKRKTYMNETIPYALSTDGGVAVSATQRIAQVHTADINGILGGVYFAVSNTYSGVENFTIEVRNNNGGFPGSTILGSKTIDVSSLALGRFSWNYFNLNDLKIKIKSGTSYFIVLYAGGSAPSWSIRRQTSNTGSTSQLSSDSGTTWGASSVGYRIRSVVYEDPNAMSTTETKLKEVNVYPNPTSDVLNIKLTKNQKSTLKIFDMSGRLIKQMEANSDNIEMNVAALPKGNYMLSISTDAETVTKKFIKN